jgi:hypothetical protein
MFVNPSFKGSEFDGVNVVELGGHLNPNFSGSASKRRGSIDDLEMSEADDLDREPIKEERIE